MFHSIIKSLRLILLTIDIIVVIIMIILFIIFKVIIAILIIIILIIIMVFLLIITTMPFMAETSAAKLAIASWFLARSAYLHISN